MDIDKAKYGTSMTSSYDNPNYEADSDHHLPSSTPTDKVDFELEGSREIIKVPSPPISEISAEPGTLTYDVPALVCEEIYEACIQYVQEHCCYSSKLVKQMALSEIINGGAFHYILETFGEKRETVKSVTPYYGQNIDGPENGPIPNPWDIVVRPPTLFQDGRTKMEMPHTAYIKPCDVCIGIGQVRCNSCAGIGGRMCSSCLGTGRQSNGSCTFCMGTGRRRCWICSGRGQVNCNRCDGRGITKMCVILIVTWTNHLNEFVSNVSSLPEKFVKKVTGNKMLFEENELVMPIVNAPDEAVNAASLSMIETHRRSFPNERILKQRHILRVVPLSKVLYTWKNKNGEFYVYGQEKKVYFEKYPQKCCFCTCL